MAIHLWNDKEHIKKLPPVELLAKNAKRGWDSGIEYQSADGDAAANNRATFTMPSFGRQGRWGNMVFQYLFMRILALNNNRDIELFRASDSINNRMNLYKDMQDIPTVQTRSTALLINDYQYQIGYIPQNLWRLMYVANVRLLKCYVLKNVSAAISQPLPFVEDDASVEVEGAFLVKSYNQQHRAFIVSQLFQPVEPFGGFLHDCLLKLGPDTTIIGIHIRRGDIAKNPLGQQFDLPIPIRYFIEWLEVNIPLLKNPVLYVSSDDANVYKEIEVAGAAVFYKEKLLPPDDRSAAYEKYEQVDWEIMRRCDVLLTSNSTFSFSAALLSTKTPTCYQFSIPKKTFEQFDPWESDPLQVYTFSRYLWSTLYSRFTLVHQMVNLKMACYRVAKDLMYWAHWKKTKVRSLYYLHGFSVKYFTKVLNVFELFQVPKNNRADPKQLF